MTKVVLAVMLLLLLQLQYRFWLGDGGIRQIGQYQARLDELSQQVRQKKERNAALYGDVLDLRKGRDAIEERARYELGMVKENETFFQVLE
ncbi:MAG: septum formation initiator family protein [Gammaproteobacteria bacterium]